MYRNNNQYDCVWTEEEEKKLEDNYIKNTDKELSKIIKNKTEQQIYTKRNNIGLTKRPQTYEVNEDFLDKPSPERSWFIGLFIADGCFSKGQINKSISFSFRQKEICDKIKSIIQSDAPIKELDWSFRDQGIMYNFSITNPSLVISFSEIFGFKTGRKSDKLVYPEEIEFFEDFLRGYFDGDGSIYLRDTNTMRLEFCSITRDFLEDLKDKIERRYGIVGNLSVHKDNEPEYSRYYKLGFSHRQAERIYDKIYNGNVRSDYKKKSFDDCIKKSKDLELKLWLKYEIDFLKNNYLDLSDKEIGNELGRDSESVKRKRWDLRLSKFD
jgi:hypothetical protein